MTTPMSDVTQPQAGTRPMSAFDQFGRKIEYLRISVTDRCNFRCLYCMPVEGLQWLPKADILSYEEIANVVAQLAPLGLRRIRITGGEPTIRPNLDELIRMLRDVSAVEDIALSTNGVRLGQIVCECEDVPPMDGEGARVERHPHQRHVCIRRSERHVERLRRTRPRRHREHETHRNDGEAHNERNPARRSLNTP